MLEVLAVHQEQEYLNHCTVRSVTVRGIPGLGRFASRGFPMEAPEYDKVYARSRRHPEREELYKRSHMQERHTRSHTDRPLGKHILRSKALYIFEGKREYPDDYVDYDIGYAKRNEDFAYDWAKRNGKTLRKVIGIQLINYVVIT